jgi:hypothetical protein
MLKFLGKKESASDAEGKFGKTGLAIGETARGLIELQLALRGAAPADLMNDEFALGYVSGMHDAQCQANRIDETGSVAIMAVSFETLFGSRAEGARALKRMLELGRHPLFLRGMTAGGNDLHDFMVSKGQLAPRQLWDYLAEQG